MNAHTREFVMVERQRLRARAERTIEALIGLLDELDGDPDEEDGGDEEPDSEGEPSLGWEDGRPERFGGGTGRRDCDCEHDQAEDGIADAEGLVEQWGGEWNGWHVG
ncbi:hypothetical protein KHC23_23035 [Ancylobacter dichloromethanicus]|uniref:Uncharacterized protein n=1 Tax=Ancylobacter dichloromethanicus TaxID=518825 RepID=A0A9W6JCT7_9HYPH|nr:hypothetical protein [Ancylobacter dichloromethanicus]MBS7556510.1 hypothetical protein [Ancylobacter dichloromethanicus]GLK74662.1 hypothetical protein GCM10017643_47810 [Ancylobacter dichloromethanicus]